MSNDAPSKARVRRAAFLARRKLSKAVREQDALDGCDLDFTEEPTPDDALEGLLEPEQESE